MAKRKRLSDKERAHRWRLRTCPRSTYCWSDVVEYAYECGLRDGRRDAKRKEKRDE